MDTKKKVLLLLRFFVLLFGLCIFSLAVNPAAVVVSANPSIFHYGRSTAKADLADQMYNSHGVVCFEGSSHLLTPYWVAAQEYTLQDAGNLAIENFIILSPNNIGFSRSYKNALLAFNYFYDDKYQPCVKVESHLGNSAGSASDHFNVDWIYGIMDTNSVGIYLVAQVFSEYSCHVVNYNLQSEGVPDPVVLTGLVHTFSLTEPSLTAHYDTAWVRRVFDTRLWVCWADVEDNRIEHQDVTVWVLLLEKTKLDDFTKPYVAGKLEVEWPGDDAGFCAQIPYGRVFDFVPYAYVALENDEASVDEADIAPGLFLWVEDAGSESFEVCGATVGGTKVAIPVGTKFSIHYLIVKRDITPDERIVHMKFTLSVECQNGCDLNGGGSTAWPSHAQHLVSFLRQEMGANAADLILEYMPRNHVKAGDVYTQIYYFRWSSPNPESDVIALSTKVPMSGKRGFVDHYDELWHTTRNAMGINGRNPAMNSANYTTQYGMECYADFNSNGCSTSVCTEIGGTSVLTHKPEISDPLGFSVCSTTPITVECNKGPCAPILSIRSLVQTGDQLIQEAEHISGNDPSGGGTTDASAASLDIFAILAIVLGCLVFIATICIIIWISIIYKGKTTFGSSTKKISRNTSPTA